MNLDNFGVIEVTLDDLSYHAEYNWANYPLGVVWAFAEKGYTLDYGFDMVIWEIFQMVQAYPLPLWKSLQALF